MVQRLEELRWEEVREAARRGAMALVPTASIEQHGTHLPVRTDTTLVSAVAEGSLAEVGDDLRVLLAPTLWLGASHHHLPFFALSIDETTYVEVVTQIGVSLAEAGFKRVLFLNGHGGNSAPLKLAVSQIRRRRPTILPAAVDYWSLGAAGIRETRTSGPGGIGHAGEFETSMMMHVAADTVTMGRETPSVPGLPDGFRRDLVAGGPVVLGVEWDRLSADGTLGDPTLASKEKGEQFYRNVVKGVAEAIHTLAALDDQALRPTSATDKAV